MLNSLKFNIYFFTLIFGTFLVVSSSSWFTSWLGLEINLMSLIPLLINQLNPYSSETSIKYFIAQALASMLIIFSSILMFNTNSTNSILLMNSMILLSLSIKMGAAPFHFWLPQVVQSAKWIQVFIILTWQKIAPMILILFTKNNFIKLIIFFSCLVGAMGAINQIIIKKIIVYSSILHTGWLISSIFCSKNIWILYFSVYSIISMSLIFSLTFSSMKNIKELFFPNLSPFIMFFIFLNFLSLAGIPPFTGFLMKLIAISLMFSMNFDPMIISILIISSLISLFYYLRLIFSSMILSMSPNKLLILSNMKSPLNLLFLSLSTFSLILFPLIFLVL